MPKYSHTTNLSYIENFAVGPEGKEKVIADSLGRMYLNFQPGNQFYVDSGSGSDSNDGLTWATALATADAAVGKCTANKGDVIWLAPGHAETLVSATGLVCDVAGVSIIGLGHGALIPTFTLGTATAATITVSAANVKFVNIKIISDLADVAAGITAAATADGLVVDGCWFTDGGLTKELVIGVSLANTIDNVLIANSRFFTTISADTGGCASAIKFVGTHNDCQILNNYIHGNYSAAAIDGITGAGVRAWVRGNDIVNIDTDAGLAINMKSDTTGFVSHNNICNLKDNAAPVVGAALAVSQNYGSNALAASGIILPAVET